MNVTMFGLLSGLGVVMAGFGMFKGGSKVGEAAESSADHVGRALDSISNDVKELKTFYQRVRTECNCNTGEIPTGAW